MDTRTDDGQTTPTDAGTQKPAHSAAGAEQILALDSAEAVQTRAAVWAESRAARRASRDKRRPTAALPPSISPELGMPLMMAAAAAGGLGVVAIQWYTRLPPIVFLSCGLVTTWVLFGRAAAALMGPSFRTRRGPGPAFLLALSLGLLTAGPGLDAQHIVSGVAVLGLILAASETLNVLSRRLEGALVEAALIGRRAAPEGPTAAGSAPISKELVRNPDRFPSTR
jgi:hypothetical protein